MQRYCLQLSRNKFIINGNKPYLGIMYFMFLIISMNCNNLDVVVVQTEAFSKWSLLHLDVI